MIESALVLAAFLGLVLGIVEVGLSLFERQTLAQRVHDAARWGAMHRYDPSAIKNFVLYGSAVPERGAAALLGLPSDAVEIANPGCPGAECRISIEVRGRGVRCVEPLE